MATQEQKRKALTQTGLYLVVITGIVVVANILAAGWYLRIDRTKNERYTLSVGSGRLVKNLKSPVQVEACVTKGLAQLDAFVRDLTDLLKEYKRAGGDKFQFTIVEANTEELKNRCKENGLEPMAFGETSQTGDDQASIAQGFMGLVFKYGSEKEVIPQLHPARGEGMEFWITNKIREIRDKAEDIKHRIGVISGKDELKLSDSNLLPKQGRQGAPSIQSIIEQTFPFYKLEEVELKEDAAIDEKLDGLIITQPRKDYTDKELQRIDEFLMRGNKSLAVFASAVEMKPNDATMQATLNLRNLDKLLLGYGIDLKKNAVFDYGAQFRLPILTQTGTVDSIRHPGIAHVIADPRFEEENQLLDNGFAAFFRMEEVAFPYPSSIELKRDKQPADVELKVVARTTESASVVTSETVDLKMKAQWSPKPPFEQRAIAAVAQGKLKSAFATKAEGITTPERAPQASRVLVVASSQFLTNPFAYAGNGPDLGPQFAMFGGAGGDPQLLMIASPYAQRYLTNTILAVKNTLDWMSGDADLLAASAKIMQEPNLTYSSIDKPKISEKDDEAAIRKKDEEYRSQRKNLQDKVQWTLIIGVPLVFAAFGIGRWRYRENKKTQRFS